MEARQPFPVAILDDLVGHQWLSKGGAADVYVAMWNGKIIAVKIGKVSGKTSLKEISNEIHVFKHLPDHPGFLTILAVLEDPFGNICGFIMPWCPESLDDYIRKLPSDEFLFAEECKKAAEVAEALGLLHESGWAHMDVKPLNVLCGLDGHMKLIDFGVSLKLVLGVATITRTCGTPGFQAPEARTIGSQVTDKADIYSFGMLLVTWVTRQQPTALCAGIRPELPDSCPRPLANLIYLCTQEAPDCRPNALECAHELRVMAMKAHEPATITTATHTPMPTLASTRGDLQIVSMHTHAMIKPASPARPVPVPVAWALSPSHGVPLALASQPNPTLPVAAATTPTAKLDAGTSFCVVTAVQRSKLTSTSQVAGVIPALPSMVSAGDATDVVTAAPAFTPVLPGAAAAGKQGALPLTSTTVPGAGMPSAAKAHSPLASAAGKAAVGCIPPRADSIRQPQAPPSQPPAAKLRAPGLCVKEPAGVQPPQRRVRRKKGRAAHAKAAHGNASMLPPHVLRVLESSLMNKVALKQGAAGTIYQATLDGKQVAAKLAKVPGNKAPSDRYQEILNEVKLLAALPQHDNLILMEAVVVDNKGRILGYIMPLCPLNLSKLLQQAREKGGLKMSRLSWMCYHICQALAALHKSGILHLDVKIDNILIGHDGRPIVADYGVSIQTRDGWAILERVCGTPGYQAPEATYTGSEVSTKADVYSFGALMWAMAELRSPSHVCSSGQPLVCSERCHPQLVELIQLCLQKDPALRPTFDQLAGSLWCLCLEHVPSPSPTHAATACGLLAQEIAPCHTPAHAGVHAVAPMVSAGTCFAMTSGYGQSILVISKDYLPQQQQYLSAGTAGKVFKAKWMGRDAAIKMANTPYFEAAIAGEVQVLLSLPPCQEFLPVWAVVLNDFGGIGGFMMPYCTGSLDDFVLDLVNKRQFTWHKLYTLGMEVGRGLAKLHELGLLHMDGKGLNILVAQDGSVKIGDLGCSLRLCDGMAQTWCECGTPGYQAPEAIAVGSIVCPKADVYSLDIILWVMAAQQYPDEAMRAGGRPVIPPFCPAQLAWLINACTSPLPCLRPTARECEAALLAMAEAEGLSQLVPPPLAVQASLATHARAEAMVVDLLGTPPAPVPVIHTTVADGMHANADAMVMNLLRTTPAPIPVIHTTAADGLLGAHPTMVPGAGMPSAAKPTSPLASAAGPSAECLPVRGASLPQPQAPPPQPSAAMLRAAGLYVEERAGIPAPEQPVSHKKGEAAQGETTTLSSHARYVLGSELMMEQVPPPPPARAVTTVNLQAQAVAPSHIPAHAGMHAVLGMLVAGKRTSAHQAALNRAKELAGVPLTLAEVEGEMCGDSSGAGSSAASSVRASSAGGYGWRSKPASMSGMQWVMHCLHNPAMPTVS